MSVEETTYFRSNASGFVYPDDNRNAADAARTITPVVVIDPEDDERVKAIVHEARWIDHSKACERVRCLLRSWTKPVAPPKPDEPTGFGAAVKDRHGVKWLHVLPNSDHGWFALDGRWRAWDELDIPEDGVKFEGVDPADA